MKMLEKQVHGHKERVKFKKTENELVKNELADKVQEITPLYEASVMQINEAQKIMDEIKLMEEQLQSLQKEMSLNGGLSLEEAQETLQQQADKLRQLNSLKEEKLNDISDLQWNIQSIEKEVDGLQLKLTYAQQEMQKIKEIQLHRDPQLEETAQWFLEMTKLMEKLSGFAIVSQTDGSITLELKDNESNCILGHLWIVLEPKTLKILSVEVSLLYIYIYMYVYEYSNN